MLQWLVCWTVNLDVQGSNPARAEILFENYIPTGVSYNSKLNYDRWEDEMARERTHTPSYAVTKKMKLLLLISIAASKVNVKDCSYSSSFAFFK